jgi:ATP-dependent DNA helicase RecG
MDLSASVQFVRGIGPQRASGLQKAGVNTIEDLLLHVPMRYQDRRLLTEIVALKPGDKVVVAGTIVVAGLRRTRSVSIYEIRLEDQSGRLKVIWFNQPFLRETLIKGRRVVLFGSVERDTHGGRGLVMSSPEHELVAEAEAPDAHAGRFVPVYEKLGPLTGRTLRRILAGLAASLPERLPDPLPIGVRERLGVIGRAEALRRIHLPSPEDDPAALERSRSPAHLRLILEEFFLFQLGLLLRRRGARGERQGMAFPIDDQTREAVKRILPFPLTGAQRRVLKEIADDMARPKAMNRLLQGDVGSGKTLVALVAMVVAAKAGYQAAFMAPTEILAEQHFLTFKRLLARQPFEVTLLTSAVKGKKREEALAAIASGAAQLTVGTHALIQGEIAFARLGLAVVDEQHRFGVLQREELARKGLRADVLVMTATPIPRTLALTAYGDLDLSVVDQKPPGRSPILTSHRSASDRREVVSLVRREVASGRQAYVVYPLVVGSEKLEDVGAATEGAALWRLALPGVQVELLHGRQPPAQKEAVMAAFAAGEVSVLVATTVVEVGVDVPNATVMVIEHAERFGLAQLHQLRGRVGRGEARSYCVLVTQGRLSEVARARVEVMLATEDGFLIAERDLEIRGPGDFFGTRQSGMPTFRVSRLIRDRELLERARSEALRYAAEAGGAPLPAELAAFLEAGGWERRFGLAQVG